MFGFDSFTLGLVFILTSGVLFLLAWGILHLVSRLKPPAGKEIPADSLSSDLPANEDAVLLIQQGGKVSYINEETRKWFNLSPNDLPNLEHVARRARPSETFLGLCAAPGKARFSMQGFLVEGNSYQVPFEGNYAILVSLHRSDLSALSKQENIFSGHTLEILTELTQTINASLNLEDTLEAILESIERLIPSDSTEIVLWDPLFKHLNSYELVGLPGTDRHLEKSNTPIDPEGDFSGFVFREQKPLLIEDISNFTEIRPDAGRRKYLYRSYLGIPLIVSDQSIGTLELYSLNTDSFSESDLEFLRTLSDTAALALHHALIHREEVRRLAELSGLAKLVETMGTLDDPRHLYENLIDSISPLLEVNVLGFIIFDDTLNQLVGKSPFIGIPDEFVELYNVEIKPNTSAEALWKSQKIIHAPKAPEDKELQTLGFAHLAQAAGIQNTVLTPLSIGGHSLGYLQAGNKKDDTPFNEDDIRFLSIVAGQTAPIIENANLVLESRQRAQQAEALRRIAGLASSAANLDEILTFSLQEIAHLIEADSAAIFTYNEDLSQLEMHRPSLFGSAAVNTHLIYRIPAGTPQFQETVTTKLQTLNFGQPNNDPSMPKIYQTLAQTLQAESLIASPLIVRDKGIGEMLFGSQKSDFFNPTDIELVSTAAGQIAGVVDRAELYTQTDETLRRRAENLTSIARIGRELNTSLDIDYLLEIVYNESIYNTGADCGTVLFFEKKPHSDDPQLVAHFAGDPPNEQLSVLEQKVVAKGEPLLIPNFSEDKYDPPHKGIGTAIVVPIIYEGFVVGLIHLHARTPYRFDQESLDTALSLAIQAGIAYHNASQFEERTQQINLLQQRVDTLHQLIESNKALWNDLSLEESLQSIARVVHETAPFKSVLISVYDSAKQALVMTTGSGISQEKIGELKNKPIPWSQIMDVLIPKFQKENVYFIPAEHSNNIPGLKLQLSHENLIEDNSFLHGMLLVPIFRDGFEKPLGIISAEITKERESLNHPMLETLEKFAFQVALAIDSHNKIETLTNDIRHLEKEVKRAKKAIEDSQTHIPLLLRKDLEQTLSIQLLNQQTLRNHAILKIAEAIHRNSQRHDVLHTYAENLMEQLSFDIVLVAKATERGPHLTHILGDISGESIPQTLLGQRNPLLHTLRTGEIVIASDLNSSENYQEWRNSPLLSVMNAQAFVCLPVVQSQNQEERTELAILGINRSTMVPFTRKDRESFSLSARHLAIWLENLNLLEETSRRLDEVDLILDFSRRLSSLKPEDILNTLVNSALQVTTAAHGGFIALWDRNTEYLVVQKALGYKNNRLMTDITYSKGQALPGRVFANGKAHIAGEIIFARDYNLSSQDLVRYQEATDGRVPISSLLLPIQAGEYTLGVLVLDNFSIPNAFKEEDQTLISSLTNQAGLILENVRLYEDTSNRAAQLQALTEVSTTITSNLQIDNIIVSLLDQLATVIPYDSGTLWLRQGDQLTIRAAQGFDDDEERYGLTVAIEDSQLLNEMIISGKPISVGNVKEDPRIPVSEEDPNLSWLGIPLITKGEAVGVIALTKDNANFYKQEHILGATTFAAQAAVALENARLYEETIQRTDDLDRRTQRLNLLNELSIELSSSLNPDQVLESTTSYLLQAIDCKRVSAILFNKEGRPLLYMEAPPNVNGELPHPINQAPLFDRLKESQGIFITNDISKEALLSPLADFFTDRKTSSLMALPLFTGTELYGITIIHGDGERFSTGEIELARTISNQAGIAIANARLFQQVQEALSSTEEQARRLSLLNEMSRSFNHARNTDEILTTMIETTAQVLHCDQVIVTLLNQQRDTYTIFTTQQRVGKTLLEGEHPLEGSVIQKAIGENQIVIDLDKNHFTSPDIRSVMVAPIPTRDPSIGTLNVGSKDSKAFDTSDQNILVQITSLAAATIDNRQLLEETRRLTEDLEKRVEERTQELAQEHQRTKALLRLITELSASLDIEIVLNQTLYLLNELADAELSVIIISDPIGSSMVQRLAQHIKGLPPEDKTTWQITEEISHYSISNHRSILVPDLQQDPHWDEEITASTFYTSVLAAPLMLGEQALGSLLLFHRNANHFSKDQLEMIQATANQIAVTINNTQLYTLTREQAERLGNMLRLQQIESSRSRAILEAVADGVLVTDSKGKISLFNRSAENILALDQERVIDKSLDDFTGLFGRAGRRWMETIRIWLDDPSAYKAGDTFSEQIILEDGRIIAVNLSPVSLGNEFLGTVSIFRDITHQIEVDQLKTEFVANVSHELRTPMTSIKGYTDILYMGAAGEISEQQANFLDIIKKNADRLSVLVNDLLSVTQIEAGKITFSKQAVDIKKILDEVISTIKRQTQQEPKSIEFHTQTPSDLPLAFGDPERIRQILDNLIDNAYKYTKDGGKVTIEIHLLGEDFIQIDVSDTGIGIPPELHKRIFERFFRSEDPYVLDIPGTGLGLPIVRSMVDIHGGEIWLESEGIPGKGSTFSFTLPVYNPDKP